MRTTGFEVTRDISLIYLMISLVVCSHTLLFIETKLSLMAEFGTDMVKIIPSEMVTPSLLRMISD